MEHKIIKFTADSMRELAYDSQYKLEEKEFQNAKEKIIAAAKQGQTFLNLTLDFPTTIKKLQNLGFKVHYSREINMTTCGSGTIPNYYKISWEEENK